MSNLLKNNSNALVPHNMFTYFNGVSSFITYNDNNNFSFTDGVNDLPFDIQFEFITGSDISTTKYILQKNNTASNFEWDIRIQSGSLRIYLFNPAGSIYIGRAATIATNTRYSVRITYDGSKAVTGINIYFNNVLQTMTNLTAGSYAGMTNGTSTFGICRRLTTYYSTYIRNVKIVKNNQLVFFAPLMDATSTDVISNATNSYGNLTAVNYKEADKWAYFNGDDNYLYYGTTSTLGWMNSGTFRIEFDIKFLRNILLERPIFCAVNQSQRGWFFYMSGTGFRFYWSNGSGTYGATPIVINATTLGKSYHIVVYGNGTIVHCTSTDNDNGGALIYDSGDVACTYVANATTTYALAFGRYGSIQYQGNCMIKNFTICSDTAGTTKFISIPFQNSYNFTKEEINNTAIGICQNVYQVDNTHNALVQYQNYTTTTVNATAFGLLKQFDFIHQGKPFRIEHDIIFQTVKTDSAGGGNRIVFNSVGSTLTPGFEFNQVNSQYIFRIWANSTTWIGGAIIGTVVVNTPYHVVVYSDGKTIWANVNGVSTSFDASAFSYSTSTSYYNWGVRLGYGYGTAEAMLRNLKIYNTTDTTGLRLFMPLQDPADMLRDVTGNYAPTLSSGSIFIKQSQWN